jgi:hypothetical protein
MARWSGWPKARRAAATPRPCGARRGRPWCSGSTTDPTAIPSPPCSIRHGPRSRSMPRADDYHDLIKKRLKRSASGCSGTFGSEVKVFVDTAPVMEKPLAAAGRPGLAGQAHQPRLARRTAPGCSSARSTPRWSWHPTPAGRDHCGLPRLPRRLPDRGLPRALPARCAALHLLSDHRASRAHPARVPRGHGQPHLWLRRLPGRLPLEQVRPRGRGNAPRAAREPRRRLLA